RAAAALIADPRCEVEPIGVARPRTRVGANRTRSARHGAQRTVAPVTRGQSMPRLEPVARGPRPLIVWATMDVSVVRRRGGCNAVVRPATIAVMRSLAFAVLASLVACGGEDNGGRRLPPDTSIDDQPAAITNQTHVRIAFHAVGNADHFTCQLDALPAVPCS